MVIGDRLKELREVKMLSQGDIEKRTGLLRCYISRVENNHTVPSVDTLEKLARALEVPMYQLFHSGTASPESANSSQSMTTDGVRAGETALTSPSWRRLLARWSKRTAIYSWLWREKSPSICESARLNVSSHSV
jgi:transcriptional regulator with XRE-family HTH domain